MQVKKFNNEEEWLEGRLGKITGTRLDDVIPKKNGDKKIGFYEIIAERIAIPANNENVMDRGHRLEDFALQRFSKETGKRVSNELVIWMRDDNPDIAVSPDGTIGKTEAVECKCLSSARHIEALLTKKIPSEYDKQKLQYFIVNDRLKKLFFVFFDPRMPKDFFYFTITRESVKDEITTYLALEKEVLAEIASIEQDLTF